MNMLVVPNADRGVWAFQSFPSSDFRENRSESPQELLSHRRIRAILSPDMSESQIQLEGTLILADPSLRDGFFNRSVILLNSHTADDGAQGLILNHPTGHSVGHFLKDKEFSHLENIPVHIGGPVSREQLTFSAFWWSPDDGLHWQLRLPAQQAIERSKQPGIIVRAFVGYSGWTAGQLESELRRDSWIPAKPAPTLFGKEHNQDLWSEILRGMSPYHRIIAEAPENPEAN